MVETAFQPNAFQNNAFQIASADADTHDGVGGGWIKRHHRKKVKKIKEEYEELLEEIKDDPHLLSAVDQYIDPISEEEKERRATAQYVVKTAPASSRIDFSSLYNNIIARERLLTIFSMLKQRYLLLRRKHEEEELLLFLLLGID